MKKIWKSLCAGMMSLAIGVGLSGCKKEVIKPVDLDGDGLVSSWETFFEGGYSQSQISAPTSNVTHIGSVDDFLAISGKEENKSIETKYVLDKNLDFGGQEVAVDLGNAQLYGNGHVLKNFTLKEINILSKDLEGNESATSHFARTFIYNGSLISNLRIFMGKQTVKLDNESMSYMCISPLFNSAEVEGVSVKGMIDVSSAFVSGRGANNLDASLIYTRQQEIANQNVVVDESVSNKFVSIRNCSAEGRIVCNLDETSYTNLCAGAIASRIISRSIISNCDSTVDIDVKGYSSVVVGGIVGENNGFVTTCRNSGYVNFSPVENTSYFASDLKLAGIAGVNNLGAEIKNCSTSGDIKYINSYDGEMHYSSSSEARKVYVAGIVGLNQGGVVSLVTMDSNIIVEGINFVCSGGICGYNNKGIVSYSICRGSISIARVPRLMCAEVIGKSIQGSIEKIITSTNITIENTDITSSNVLCGMITVFEKFSDPDDNETAIPDSPYFQKILDAGTTKVNFADRDKANIHLNLGIRNSYQIQKGTTMDEDGEEVPTFTTKLPLLFSNIYYLENSYQLYQNGVVVDKHFSREDNSAYDAIKSLSRYGLTTQNLIRYFDFKSYLNHNEVNMDSNVDLASIGFNLDSSMWEVSYFGSGRYNGELSYYDREFDIHYTHSASSAGRCDFDDKDEMLSFIYDFVKTYSSSDSLPDNYAIKLNNGYFDEFSDDYAVQLKTQLTSMFENNVSNLFQCIGVTSSIKESDRYNVDSAENVDAIEISYVKFTFSDSKATYELMFDVRNLQNDLDTNYQETSSSTSSDLYNYNSYIVYVKLTTKGILTNS